MERTKALDGRIISLNLPDEKPNWPASFKRTHIYTDFEDEIGPHSEIEIRGKGPGLDAVRFRDKALFCLRGHLDHIAVQKARRNEPLTEQDLSELERLFQEAGLNNLEPVKTNGGFGPFIRSLVGLHREAAKELFAEFMRKRTPTADQIEFVNLIIDYLTERGAMDPRLLYESPFTDIHDSGVAGLFPSADVVELVSIIESVRKSAA